MMFVFFCFTFVGTGVKIRLTAVQTRFTRGMAWESFAKPSGRPDASGCLSFFFKKICMLAIPSYITYNVSMHTVLEYSCMITYVGLVAIVANYLK